MVKGLEIRGGLSQPSWHGAWVQNSLAWEGLKQMKLIWMFASFRRT